MALENPFIPSQSSKVAGAMPAKDQMSDTVLPKLFDGLPAGDFHL
jgi:hypothetical protein